MTLSDEGKKAAALSGASVNSLPGKKRREIPWSRIYNEYRLGQLAIIEIARQHGISDAAIHKKARQLGWTGDLTSAVRTKVREELESPSRARHELVQGAVKRALEVIVLHRRDITKLRDQEQRLLKELGDNPTKTIFAKATGDPIEVDIPLPEQASILRDLATVQAKRIELERQAYNLDDTAGSEEDQETIAITHYRVAPFSEGSYNFDRNETEPRGRRRPK